MNLNLKVGSIRSKKEFETEEEVKYQKEKGIEGIEINSSFEVEDFYQVSEAVINLLINEIKKNGGNKNENNN